MYIYFQNITVSKLRDSSIRERMLCHLLMLFNISISHGNLLNELKSMNFYEMLTKML